MTTSEPPSLRTGTVAGGAEPGKGEGGAPVTVQGPLLEVERLVAGYGGGDVLREITLQVPRGSITCIVGPNGAGKSTLLAVLSGMLKPRKGRVVFNGRDVTGWLPRQVLSAGMVLVPQEHSLFRDMTVRENVAMGAFTLRDKALVWKRLKAIEELFPIVEQRAAQKAGSLSGGQQRLVEFARCLMLDPKLVVLDEPSMGLDPKTLRVVFQTVRKMNESGRTVLLVEQNARAGLKLSSHGIVMESGRARLSGTGDEVLRHPEIASLYLGGAPRA
jgi:ABC-type branched-subunit amino acid transport system ATPase component